jgi:sec-independent protein translocase protein TatB
MFEFDAGKFVIIGIVALIVIGPKELPRVMRQVGQMVAKLRRLSAEFQAQFMDAMREADLQEDLEAVKAEAAKIAAAARLDHTIDPLAGIRSELTKPEPLPTHAELLAQPVAEPLAEPVAEPRAEALGEPLDAPQAIAAEAAPAADVPQLRQRG